MIVGVCGFGYSGSSALVDLLNESDIFEVRGDFEFSFTYKPDGLEDLERSITSPSRYFSSDSAIRRFIQYTNRMTTKYNSRTNVKFSVLTDKYIDDIVSVKWIGSTSVHIYQASRFNYIFKQKYPRIFRYWWEKRFGPIPFKCPPDTIMYYSALSEEEFLTITKEYIMSIVSSLRRRRDSIIVLDQPFSADSPQRTMKYFDNPYAIIVHRDPRDVYLLAKRAVGMTAKFVPTQNVNDFIEYYKGLMNHRNIVSSENVLEVQFEDLIYDYSHTVEVISSFLGVDYFSNQSLFKPDVSINNTQLFIKYKQYDNDIHIIEQQLSDYLYPFSRYDLKPNFNTKSF